MPALPIVAVGAAVVAAAVVLAVGRREEPLPACWTWVPPLAEMRFIPDPDCRAHRPPPTWLFDPMFLPE